MSKKLPWLFVAAASSECVATGLQPLQVLVVPAVHLPMVRGSPPGRAGVEESRGVEDVGELLGEVDDADAATVGLARDGLGVLEFGFIRVAGSVNQGRPWRGPAPHACVS
jgi:hypothetical protein